MMNENNDQPELPAFVYLPCTTHVQDPADAVVEFRRVADDRLALMTYSSLDQLKSCCGDQQPWLGVPTSVLEHLHQAQPYDLVLVDVVIPEELRAVPQNPQPRHTTA
ncbi:hypothetical protein HUO13_26740 [Saccharopolyspora erythraea]|uniref:SAV_915 family protein n=1 Tax=Saccharopolyspora erythraea TaxID=1836 RepID=UPI001BA676B8|nr:SAV_915 family protein [Saccharopolyspora erythraea]QUH03934.1 hypothetical protein HUO13_26740 [Saccharopolyspora erythraea]